LLGNVEGINGEAIVILTPKLQDQNKLNFSEVITSFVNDIYGRFTAELSSSFDIQFIFPINEKHKNKYRKRETIIHR